MRAAEGASAAESGSERLRLEAKEIQEERKKKLKTHQRQFKDINQDIKVCFEAALNLWAHLEAKQRRPDSQFVCQHVWSLEPEDPGGRTLRKVCRRV